MRRSRFVNVVPTTAPAVIVACVMAVIMVVGCGLPSTSEPVTGSASGSSGPAGDGLDDPGDSEAAPVDDPETDAVARLIEVIDLLAVADEPERRGYDRDLFEHWLDIDQSGCTARQDVLLAHAIGLAQRDPFDPCFIVEADWYLPYDGGRHSGQPGDVDIDHVVALAEAWDSGAAEWSRTRRRQFANDPLNLLVSDPEVNRAKADLDVADWRPAQRSSWCLTTTMIALTKLRYDLSIDPAESRSLREMARSCGDDGRVGSPTIPLPGTTAFDDVVLAILAERGRSPSG